MTNAPEQAQGEGPYLRIGQMAEKFDVTLRALRFYEDKGLIAPKRSGTTRLYSRRDQARLKLILMGRAIGFSLDDIQEMLELYEPRSGNVTQLTRALQKADEQLERLNKQRAEIERAIELLIEATSAAESELAKAKERNADKS